MFALYAICVKSSREYMMPQTASFLHPAILEISVIRLLFMSGYGKYVKHADI